MVLKVFFIVMIAFALFAVHTSKLRRAVIYTAIFSLVSSLCYLLYSAPDVAIAEAIIGSTIATILYLVALQKYKVFTIYYTNEGNAEINDSYISAIRGNILDSIERFCVKKELEPQVIYTLESLEHIKKVHQYDLIVRRENEKVYVYGNRENYQMESLREYMIKKGLNDVQFIAEQVELME